jgi:hypothetical protein
VVARLFGVCAHPFRETPATLFSVSRKPLPFG